MLKKLYRFFLLTQVLILSNFLTKGADLLKECTNDSECPAHASCQSRWCYGKICLCDDLFTPSHDEKSCVQGRNLGQICGPESKCSIPQSECLNGTCKCHDGHSVANASNIDLLVCVTNPLDNVEIAVLGQKCDDNIRCVGEYVECRGSVCHCATGYRGATVEEMRLFPFVLHQCIPESFKPDRTVNITGECPKFDLVKQTYVEDLMSTQQSLFAGIPTRQPFTATSPTSPSSTSTVTTSTPSSVPTTITTTSTTTTSTTKPSSTTTMQVSTSTPSRSSSSTSTTTTPSSTSTMSSTPSTTRSTSSSTTTKTTIRTTTTPSTTTPTSSTTKSTTATSTPSTLPSTTSTFSSLSTTTESTTTSQISSSSTKVSTITSIPSTPVVTVKVNATTESSKTVLTGVLSSKTIVSSTEKIQPETTTVHVGSKCGTCPDNSECEQDSCSVYRCRCKLGYANSPDRTECWKLSALGEDCTENKICQGPFTVCDGVCKCEEEYEPSDNGRWCRLKDSWFIDFPLLGEQCSGRLTADCYMEYEQTCVDDICKCKEGLRGVDDDDDRKAMYPGISQCRNSSLPAGYRPRDLCEGQSRETFTTDIYDRAKSKIRTMQGAIIGGSIGGIALIGIIVGTVALVRWKRRERRGTMRDTSSTASTEGQRSRYSFKIPRPFATYESQKEYDSNQISYPNTALDSDTPNTPHNTPRSNHDDSVDRQDMVT